MADQQRRVFHYFINDLHEEMLAYRITSDLCGWSIISSMHDLWRSVDLAAGIDPDAFDMDMAVRELVEHGD